MPESLPMPGGALPSKDIVVPYSGGEVRLSPEAQVAQKAAAEFTSSFQGYQGPNPNRKHNRLDGETQNNLDELVIYMRRNRPKPATIINLHPFELQFNADNILLRGHIIPPCLPGMPYSHKAIRGWRHDNGSYNENGSRKFKAILPIDVAGQFAREFNKIETFGPGVLIYTGDSHPDKVGQVETFDPMGRPITVDVKGEDFDEEDRPFEIVMKQPVMASFPELLRSMRDARNAFYMSRVQEADDWAKQQDGKARRWIQKSHRMMAEMLVAEGRLPFMPDWGLSSKIQQGLAEDNCPSCQNPVKASAFKCVTCGHILDALAAFKDGAIEFDHAKVGLLPDEQYKEAEAIQKEREKRFAKRAKKAEKD
jgi:hypothetical protein